MNGCRGGNSEKEAAVELREVSGQIPAAAKGGRNRPGKDPETGFFMEISFPECIFESRLLCKSIRAFFLKKS